MSRPDTQGLAVEDYRRVAQPPPIPSPGLNDAPWYRSVQPRREEQVQIPPPPQMAPCHVFSRSQRTRAAHGTELRRGTRGCEAHTWILVCPVKPGGNRPDADSEAQTAAYPPACLLFCLPEESHDTGREGDKNRSIRPSQSCRLRKLRNIWGTVRVDGDMARQDTNPILDVLSGPQKDSKNRVA